MMRGTGVGASQPPEPGNYRDEGISTMFDQKVIPNAKVMLLAGILASSILVTPPGAQFAARAETPLVAAAPTHYQANRFSRRAGMYYGLVWGVDSLGVKATESGEIIRFTYRVLDAEKAKALNSKKSEP